MKILAIETSCDETAISIVECEGNIIAPRFQILSEVVLSQLTLHTHWGGVVPTIAKREHEKTLVPVLQEALLKANLFEIRNPNIEIRNKSQIQNILNREQVLLPEVIKFLETYATPAIDTIAVTQGPGLEPTLWVGINFAKALAMAWQKPLIPVNHMEGHLISPILGENVKLQMTNDKSNLKSIFPMIALLVSGGHTELVLVKAWGDYQKIGETRDDAAGEAFDKVARLLGLGYPGGPAISKIAAEMAWNSECEGPRAPSPTARPDHSHSEFQALHKIEMEGAFRKCSGRAESEETRGTFRKAPSISLPRPMLNSDDFDFSFSGLKTAVRYLVEKMQKDDPLILERQWIRSRIAYEFQEAVVDVLVAKTERAAKTYEAKSILVGGGVSANKRLRQRLPNALFPSLFLSTDNATMIAAAGYLRWLGRKQNHILATESIRAEGNLRIE